MIGTTELIILVIPLVVIIAILISRKQSKKYSKDIPLSWFYFYTYFRLPLSVVFGLIMIIGTEEPVYALVAFLYTAGLIVLFIGLNQRKLWGWNLNMIFLIYEALQYASLYGKGNIIYIFTVFIVACLIWVLPNYIYFKKRIHLFT